MQLCSSLAKGVDVQRLALRRLNASTGETERASCIDVNSFLQRSWGWKGSLRQWLQAASEEPAASFLSTGAVSTAQSLGLVLVQWVGKPQGRYPGVYTLAGLSGGVMSIKFSPDGKLLVSGATTSSQSGTPRRELR